MTLWSSVEHRYQRDYSCHMPDGYYWEIIKGDPMGCYTLAQGHRPTLAEARAAADLSYRVLGGETAQPWRRRGAIVC